ncbi:energy-coupling factor transporter transmembrane component T family protein [Halovivax cerinus]|uniref:Energy-coupling factor transporter transmembrane component T family protein n=1 Tax=Halovivax cerinus TaxID=1487865 RepID=A0ABD5NNP2_9EURY|nr:energy-coupling factor transporter transmembrane component T [Halovivax cerinus]
MLAYEPDETIAHGLDPRAKLAFQVAFAVAALARPSIVTLAALTVLARSTLATAGLSPVSVLYGYRHLFAFLALSVLLAAVTVGPPWIDVAGGVRTARAAYGVGLVLLVSAAYVRSTPVRHSRAAIQRLVPGAPGRLLGLGVSLVFRFLPVVRHDVLTIRDAMAVRLGTERSMPDRAATIGARSLTRAFARADRLSVAMQARCLSWNATLPRLSFSRDDWLVVAFSLAVGTSPLW